MASIYITQSSDKADISIDNPFSSYRDYEKDEAISNGYLYVGVVDRDGEIPENRKRVYAILESGAALEIEQPVRLSAGGVPSYNGYPVRLATDGSYSLKVKDYTNTQVYFTPKVVAKSLLGYSGFIPEEVQEKDGSTLSFSSIEVTTATFYIADGRAPNTTFNGVLMQKGVDYEPVNESTIKFLSTYANGSAVLGRALDPVGNAVAVEKGTSPIYLFDTQAEAKLADLSIGESVIINGKDSINDGKGGSYVVVSTGEDDGINVISINNGNKLQIKKTYQALQGIYETQRTLTSTSGKVTIDLADGSVFKLPLTEDVSDIEVLNIPPSGEVKIEIKVIQPSDSAKTLAWQINGIQPLAAGGTIPAITAAVDAIDRYILLTDDSGSTFEIYTAAQDLK